MNPKPPNEPAVAPTPPAEGSTGEPLELKNDPAAPSPAGGDEPKKRGLLAVLAGVTILALGLGIGFVALRDDDSQTATNISADANSAGSNIDATGGARTAPDRTVAGNSGSAGPSSAAPSTASPTTGPPSSAPEPPVPPPTSAPPATQPSTTGVDTPTANAVRGAVYRDGKLYLKGRIPSQELADEIAAKGAAVVGEANVVVEYEIDPDAPLPQSAPLYVEDYVLFDPASTAIGADFEPILDLGIVVLNTLPEVTVTVRGHTDSSGSDALNLQLSQDRVDAIIDYWHDRGITADRVDGIGFGEAEPIASNDTEEGRRQNRRVEFILTGVLD